MTQEQEPIIDTSLSPSTFVDVDEQDTQETNTLNLKDTPKPAPKKQEEKKYTEVKLSKKHWELINDLTERGCAEWDAENGRLQSHTAAVKKAHSELQLKGEFETLASGKDLPRDRNCFLYPIEKGGWLVCRYKGGKGGPPVKEADTWLESKAGSTYCLLNMAPKRGDILSQIVNLAMREFNFFHALEGKAISGAFAEVERYGHTEVVPVEGDTFRRVLRITITENMRDLIALSDHFKNVTDHLRAYAIERAPEYPVYVRVAGFKGNFVRDIL